MNTLLSNNEDDSNNQNELSGEDAVKLLVGEGKKYATNEELAKAMIHSQAHITKLEGEATSLKDSQTKQTSLDEILAAVKAKGTDTNVDDNQLPADQQPADTTSQVDITKQIQTALAEQAQTNSAATNTKLVSDALNKSLGGRANEVYSAVGKDLGVDLDELAKTSPDAVIKLCTGQQGVPQQQSTTPLARQFTSQQPAAQPDGSMTYDQIQALATETKMPRETRFKLEMENALKMGDNFYNKQ